MQLQVCTLIVKLDAPLSVAGYAMCAAERAFKVDCVVRTVADSCTSHSHIHVHQGRQEENEDEDNDMEPSVLFVVCRLWKICCTLQSTVPALVVSVVKCLGVVGCPHCLGRQNEG